MLNKAAPERAVDAAVHAYLHETLGIAPKVRAWPGAGKLPYFLQDAFDVRELKLLDRQILLAIDKRPDKPGLANVRGQMDKLRQLAGMPVVYVTGTLASYERKRLIEQKVPFLVPGNQLYLPDLGIDLREYFRKPPAAPDTALSPATQAMLITVLLRRPWRAEWQPAEVVSELGYTADDPVPGRQGAHGRRHRDIAHRGEGAMAAHGAHCRGDVGASEAIVAQPDQASILGPSRSQVEAAPREAGRLERSGAVFDAFRAAVADLCRQPGAVEGSDEGRHRDPA